MVTSNIKKTIAIVLVSTFVFTAASAFRPKPAQAVVGLATGGTSMLIVGGVLAGVGGLGGIATIACLHSAGGGPLCLEYGALGALPFLAGLIVLDAGEMQFGHLTTAQAQHIGLSDEEYRSYEEDLDETNAVLQDQIALRQAELARTGKLELSRSRADWLREGQALRPATFSAVQKIAAYSVHQAQAKTRIEPVRR